MFSWQIWDKNLTDNSKIGDEFEQNKLSEVCIWTKQIQFILSFGVVIQICRENINKPLDSAYLADFGIDIILDVTCKNVSSSFYTILMMAV